MHIQFCKQVFHHALPFIHLQSRRLGCNGKEATAQTGVKFHQVNTRLPAFFHLVVIEIKENVKVSKNKPCPHFCVMPDVIVLRLDFRCAER